jgi:hypothetical protein
LPGSRRSRPLVRSIPCRHSRRSLPRAQPPSWSTRPPAGKPRPTRKASKCGRSSELIVTPGGARPTPKCNVVTVHKAGTPKDCRAHCPKKTKSFPPSRLVCPSEKVLSLFVRQPAPALVSKTVRKHGAAHEDLSVPSPHRCPSPRARIIRKGGPRRSGRNPERGQPCSLESTFQKIGWR